VIKGIHKKGQISQISEGSTSSFYPGLTGPCMHLWEAVLCSAKLVAWLIMTFILYSKTIILMWTTYSITIWYLLCVWAVMLPQHSRMLQNKK
jgi:hypothetical protein